jgi:hypothetical protein
MVFFKEKKIAYSLVVLLFICSSRMHASTFAERHHISMYIQYVLVGEKLFHGKSYRTYFASSSVGLEASNPARFLGTPAILSKIVIGSPSNEQSTNPQVSQSSQGRTFLV